MMLSIKYWVSFIFLDLHKSVEQILQFTSIHCHIYEYDIHIYEYDIHIYGYDILFDL